MQNCPNGCEDCPHELCPCADNGGEDYQTCADFFEAQFWLCAKNCDHDEACFSACNREYDKNLLKCPCQAGCPNGEGIITKFLWFHMQQFRKAFSLALRILGQDIKTLLQICV